MIYRPNARLDLDKAPHFYHREVAKSYVAAREGIDNNPTSEVLEAARLLAIHCLEPVRARFGPFTPSSWYRSESLEKVIARRGYKKWLRRNRRADSEKAWRDYFARKSHPRGEAADIEVSGVSNDYLFEWCRDNLEFDQLIREFATPGDPQSGWVHISFKLTGNRNEAFHIGG